MNCDTGVRPGADFRIHVWIVRNNQDVVLGHRNVHLQEINPHIDGVVEGWKGILRPHSPRAAVSVDQNAWCGVYHLKTGRKQQARPKLFEHISKPMGRFLLLNQDCAMGLRPALPPE